MNCMLDLMTDNTMKDEIKDQIVDGVRMCMLPLTLGSCIMVHFIGIC